MLLKLVNIIMKHIEFVQKSIWCNYISIETSVIEGINEVG